MIRSLRNGGTGIEVFAHDPKTGDGVIPHPFGICDELHRHPDMRLWDLWGGKCRKRDAQMIGISTGGEPETAFENLRDAIRLRASEKSRSGKFGSHVRAAASDEVMHEWMVPSDQLCTNMDAVKDANPLSTITEAGLTEDFALVTNLNDWKRLKCSRPTRSAQTAITDKEFDDALTDVTAPEGALLDIGLDWAPKWDTTAVVGLWKAPKFRVAGPVRILVPPRDGSQMHPDEVKFVLNELAEGYTIGDVVMDMERAGDIAAWIEDTMGVRVIDRGQSNKHACADYEAVMDGLRNGTLKHNGDHGLRAHVLNAIARRLPGGDYRFDRPSTVRSTVHQQDVRVIDALTALGMVVEHSTRAAPRRSVYEDRGVIVA